MYVILTVFVIVHDIAAILLVLLLFQLFQTQFLSELEQACGTDSFFNMLMLGIKQLSSLSGQ